MFSQLRKRESVSVGERKAGLVVGNEVRRVLTAKCIRRLERLEWLELIERPTFAGDRGFGKIDMIVTSAPAGHMGYLAGVIQRHGLEGKWKQWTP
jgi:hypothetical protein